MRLILALGLTLAVAGCGAAADKHDGDPLAGTAWTLDELTGTALPAGAAVTLQFHEGRIGGSAGCNRYFASYAVAADSLRIGPAGATKMMCPEPQMTVEAAFLGALAEATTYSLADGRLRIALRTGGDLSFAAAPFAAPTE